MKTKKKIFFQILATIFLSLGLTITAANRLLGGFFWGRSFLYQLGIIVIPAAGLITFLYFHFVKSEKSIRLFAIFLSFILWIPVVTYEVAWKAFPTPNTFNNHYLQIDENHFNNINSIEGISYSGNRVKIAFDNYDPSHILIPYDIKEITLYFSCGPNGQEIMSKIDGNIFTLPSYCQQESETTQTQILYPRSKYIFLTIFLCLAEWASALLLSVLVLGLCNFNFNKIINSRFAMRIRESDVTRNAGKPDYFLEKKRLIVLASFGIVIFGMILELNSHTALLADDYVQSFNFMTGEKIQSFQDIFPIISNLYDYWTGRLFIHFLCYLAIIIDKNVFNLVNSFFYVYYLILVYLLSTTGSLFKNALLNLVLINFLIWFFTPVFGETVLWRSGGPTYVWNFCIILSAMFPFFLYFRKIYRVPNNPLSYGLFFIIGFISGMGQENSSAALLFYLVFMVLYFWLIRNETNIWMFAEVLGCWSGYWFLILAPGNVIRANNFPEPGFLGRISMVYTRFIEDIFLMLLILIILFIFSRIIKKPDPLKNHFFDIQIPLFVLCSLISLVIMVFAKWYPQRASFGPVAFLIMAIMVYFREITQRILNVKIQFLLTVLFTVIFSVSYMFSYSDLSGTYSKWTERLSLFEESKGKSVDTVTVKIIRSSDSHNPYSSLIDISENPEGWPNYVIAKYYGISSITGIE